MQNAEPERTELDQLAQAARWGSRAGKSLTREWSEISEFSRERWRNVVRSVLACQTAQRLYKHRNAAQ